MKVINTTHRNDNLNQPKDIQEILRKLNSGKQLTDSEMALLRVFDLNTYALALKTDENCADAATVASVNPTCDSFEFIEFDNDSLGAEKGSSDTAAMFDIFESDTAHLKTMLENLCEQLDASKDNDKMLAEFKRQFLTGLLTRVEIMQGDVYSSRSWSQLMGVYGVTKPVSLNENADLATIEKAIKDLTAAFNSLRKAEEDDTKLRERLPLVIKTGGTAHEQAGMVVFAETVAQLAIQVPVSIDVRV